MLFDGMLGMFSVDMGIDLGTCNTLVCLKGEGVVLEYDDQALTRVQPDVVVEISADAALQAGVFRHPLRYVRTRPDLRAEDLPDLP